MSDMPGMDMSEKDMRDMGPRMAAMSGHMMMTSLRSLQPGDEERAKAVVAAAKAVMDEVPARSFDESSLSNGGTSTASGARGVPSIMTGLKPPRKLSGSPDWIRKTF